jgi:serralysin
MCMICDGKLKNWNYDVSEDFSMSMTTAAYNVDLGNPSVSALSSSKEVVLAFANEPTTSVSLTGNQMIDALVAGNKFAGLALTFGFPTSRADYEANYTDTAVDTFSPVNDNIKTAARYAFDFVTNLTALTVTETNTPSEATFRLGMSTKPTTAYAYYPTSTDVGGDSWYGQSASFPIAQKGNYGWYTVLHELGHNLGLAHGHETRVATGQALPSARDAMEFSIMTYRSSIGATTSGVTNERWGYAQTFMMGDIATLQHLYGADFGYNNTNSVYYVSEATGELLINGQGQGQAGGNRTFLTVWDGGGSDTYDYSNFSSNQSIDLRAGFWSSLSPSLTANLGAGNFAKGNVYNAYQYQNDRRSLIENAIGGAGNDLIRGNQAANLLQGGAGFDSINAGSGNDTILAGSGNDLLEGDFVPQFSTISSTGIVVSGAGPIQLTGNVSHLSDVTALDITQSFSLLQDTNIVNSTTNPHASISSVGEGGAQWFRVEVNAGTEITADIDASVGFDSHIQLYFRLPSGSNRLMIENDDARITLGAAGSTNANDSFLRYVALSTGTYYLVVGTFDNKTTLPVGSSFVLHVSVNGTASEVLTDGGVEGDDVLDGGLGDDVIYGYGGDDYAVGGDGNDTLAGGTGNDILILSDGNDVAFTDSNSTADFVYGGQGDDTISGGSGVLDVLIGEAGNDSIVALEGQTNYLFGGTGDNFMSANGTLDVYISEGLNDAVASGSTRSLIYRLASGSAFVTGGNGSDEFVGGNAQSNDTVFGNGGNDYLYAGRGDDLLSGGAGNDVLIGQVGNDTLDGGAGVNLLWANDTGSDQILVHVADGGTQVVEFFEAGGVHDMVRLLGSSIISFDGILNLIRNIGVVQSGNLMVNAGSGAQLYLNVGATQTAIWFQGVSAYSLTSSDFLFS